MAEKNQSDFGRNIRWLREKRLMTQKELAKRCGLFESSISHFEIGSRQPSHKNLKLLANALNCSIDWLMGLTLDENMAFNAHSLSDKILLLRPDDFILVEQLIQRLSTDEEKNNG